jgi:hypothetical protein
VPKINFLVAIVKWNGGVGALLCNTCRTIIAHGFDHEDKVHHCDKCVPPQDFLTP